MIDFLIYDENLVAQGIIDTQNSVMWERRFYEAGYFEIHVQPNDNNNALLSTGRYILRTDARESGVIQYIYKNTDSLGTSDITIIGRFMSYILHGHIIRSAGVFSGNAESVMRQLVENTCMTPATTDYISGLELGDLCGTEKTVSIFLEYTDLHDALREIARLTGVAFRITLNPTSGTLVFECYEGHNYSADGGNHSVVVFSSEYDTIIGEVSCSENDAVTVNAVTMVYSGEFGRVAVRYTPTSVSGTALHEISVVTDKCETTTSQAGGKVLDVEGTKALLMSMAPRYIKAKEESVSASVTGSGSFKYKEDYDIGDIVTIEHKPYGISLTKRIHKITESYSEYGYEIIPEFGDIKPKELT